MTRLEEQISAGLKSVDSEEPDIDLDLSQRRTHHPKPRIASPMLGALLGVAAAITIPLVLVGLGLPSTAPGRTDIGVLASAKGAGQSSATTGRYTMSDLIKLATMQHFRPYSGPQPPPVTEEQALAGRPGAYIVGLTDIGFDKPTGIQWHSAWVVFWTSSSPNVTVSPSGPNATPTIYERDGVNHLEVIDTTTGRRLAGYVGIPTVP